MKLIIYKLLLYYIENDSDIIDFTMMMFLVFIELRTFCNNKQSKAHALYYNIIMKRNHKIDYRHFDELSIQSSISNFQLYFHDGNNFQYR